MTSDQHTTAAIEVWNTMPCQRRATTTRRDFIIAFTLGRVSMKACFDKAELLHADDPTPDRPFTPEQTNQ